MQKTDGTSRYTAEELARLVREQGSLSDWLRTNAKSYEIEADAYSDEAEADMTIDWANALIGLPK